MKVCNYNLHPYPGYEKHVAMMLQTDAEPLPQTERLQDTLLAYEQKNGETIADLEIPGGDNDRTILLRIFRPDKVMEKAPVIMDVHGGGFTKGSPDIDHDRALKLARYSGCIVVSVAYRLTTPEVHFPGPLYDCYTAWCWLSEHAEELGGDPEKAGLHGTSAGGGLCAGLALFLRDKGKPAPLLTVLNCPTLNNLPTVSLVQFGNLKNWNVPYHELGYVMYAQMNSGNMPSYYATPGKCEDLRGLGPHMIITAEYDPLRDEGLTYALRLLERGIPCELFSAPRVTHGFCAVDHPLSRFVHRGIAASFRREFGLAVSEI